MQKDIDFHPLFDIIEYEKGKGHEHMNDFIAAMTNTEPQPGILVYFKGCTDPTEYTAAIMDLLKTDPDTQTICDAETGEILFSRD